MATINVYLRGNMSDLEGFVPDKRHSTIGYCQGFSFYLQNGRWYFTLSDPSDKIPAFLLDCVEEISLYEALSREIRRESGIYLCGTAEAELASCDERGRSSRVRIRGKSMEDVRELLRRIKTGSIRPDESYEAKQAGMSRAELEKELEDWKLKARVFEDHLRKASDELNELQNLRLGIARMRWPLLWRKWVDSQLYRILISSRGRTGDAQ